MRRSCLLLVLLALPCPAPAAERAARGEGNVYVLGIAIDQYPNKAGKETLDTYDWCAEEITTVFREAGRSLFGRVQTRMLLGREVTHRNAVAALAWLHRSSGPRDLVVLYVGAHGFTDPKDGWGIETADKQTLWGHEIKAALGRLPCQALVAIETCTSGGFAAAHRKDVPLPPNVTALCACRAQQSTDNHLDIALSEALWGQADFDKDGVVDLDELLRYVRLRHKELVAGERKDGGGEMPVLVRSKTAPPRLALTRAWPRLAAVAFRGDWHLARVLKEDGDKYQVHLLGWSSKPGPYFLTDTADRAHVCLPNDPPPVKVEAGGKNRLARLLSRDGKEWTVQYLGVKKPREETVARERVKLLFGTEVGRQAASGYVAPSIQPPPRTRGPS